MSALSLGMLGFVLGLMGMECTFIGGKDRSKYKKIYFGGWCHVIGGNVQFDKQDSQKTQIQHVSVTIPDDEGISTFNSYKRIGFHDMFLHATFCKCPHNL